MSTIELIATAKHSGSIKAADAVDLHANEGESVIILGPGGSGKTTLPIPIAGLAPPISGAP